MDEFDELAGLRAAAGSISNIQKQLD